MALRQIRATGPTGALHFPATPVPAGPSEQFAVSMRGTRNAYYRGRKLNLTAMECEILEQLLRSSGRAVSRDELSLPQHHRPASPFDRAVNTHVSRIRHKMGDGRGAG